jgi:pre-mRNA-processing factor 19
VKEQIKSISFSPNGYHLASCAEEDDTIRIWDIRKGKIFKTFSCEESNLVSRVQFDDYGRYLGFCGHSIGVYEINTGEVVYFKNENKNLSSSFRFMNKNKTVISANLEGEFLLFN